MIQNGPRPHYGLSMTHREAIDGEVAERYALGRLSPGERRAFQEHFFECGDCFARAQETSRFVAGVRHAARAGVLPARPAVAPTRRGWLRPAFAAAAFASVLLTAALGWLLFSQMPGLREDLARERQARAQAERDNQRRLSQANEALADERRQRESERARLESQLELLAQQRPPAGADGRPRAGAPPVVSQANTPLVILDAVRGARGGAHQLALGGGAAAATIWIEVGPGESFDGYRLQIFRGGRLVETVSGAKPNAYGAVAVTVPARLLRPGAYVVKLFGVKDKKPELVGEYDLSVRGAR